MFLCRVPVQIFICSQRRIAMPKWLQIEREKECSFRSVKKDKGKKPHKTPAKSSWYKLCHKTLKMKSPRKKLMGKKVGNTKCVSYSDHCIAISE